MLRNEVNPVFYSRIYSPSFQGFFHDFIYPDSLIVSYNEYKRMIIQKRNIIHSVDPENERQDFKEVKERYKVYGIWCKEFLKPDLIPRTSNRVPDNRSRLTILLHKVG